MSAPRSRLADMIQREEAGRTGVYFLTGSDPDDTLRPIVYLGETDNIKKRLTQHNKDETKEFWDRVCVVTSKDQNLTKAHVRYLEGRLIETATKAGRAKLINGTAPEFGLLPEADIADMEFFIEQIRIVLPVLGLDFLRAPSIQQAPSVATTALKVPVGQSPIFEINSKKLGLRAEAQEFEGDFVVFKGSLAREKWAGAEGQTYQRLHQQLIKNGILSPSESGLLAFQNDYAFKSPSAASAVIYGRASNGRLEWCVKGTKTTYAKWQESEIEAVNFESNTH